MKTIIADASAIIAYLDFEKGADVVLEQLPNIAITAVNLAEVVTVLTHRNVAKAWIENEVIPLFRNVVPLNAELAILTGTLVTLTKELGLSLGDRACLAAAIAQDARVLTADTAWKKLKLGIEIELIR